MSIRRSGLRLAGLLALVASVAACGSDPTSPDFDSSLGIDLAAMNRSGTGLYWQDLAVGTGDPVQPGTSVTVGYSGWLPDGRLFDSGSFPFTLGSGVVIPGFDEGVTGMRPGGKRKLVIPPELGYGSRAVGSIPPNSTLVFEVELQKVN